MPQTDCSKALSLMDLSVAQKVRDFHRSFPQYGVTPLAGLDNLAGHLGVGGIYVKDESFRFGLNAFKVLGATFAMASFIAKAKGCPVWELDYPAITSPKIKKELGSFTFFATTDGNHGRAVAWSGARLGQKSVIYMPKGSLPVRLENIKREGAGGFISEYNYDETVRFTAALAEKTPGGVVVQDTAWEGYEEIPSWIMQGYGTMVLEAVEQLGSLEKKPTHIIIQAGVGSVAGSVQAFAQSFYGDGAPTIFVVEAAAADCHYRSVLKGTGQRVSVGGEHDTIMAGLACGEPNPISWDILKAKSDYFVSMEDSLAARGMRVLGAPLPGDPRVISGESGAAGMGFLTELLTSPDLADLRKQAKIDKDSQILLFSTEGDTDPDTYRRIVWQGDYNS